MEKVQSRACAGNLKAFDKVSSLHVHVYTLYMNIIKHMHVCIHLYMTYTHTISLILCAGERTSSAVAKRQQNSTHSHSS